eukprot:TRINITY_DN4585_c0_g1_i1.p1 TRINITY_DN4585_c0_g1~~TRINITY_DN4585_c0_g1_i1.p1  ORF type:complete len:399 (-),score=86.63 TRINITY_DN4585_c0_g1_i1:41-1108(-)
MAESKERALEFVLAAVDIEIENLVQPQTIFRGNTAASKMFKTYGMLIGCPYLFKTMAPFVKQIEHIHKTKEEEDDITLGLLDIDFEVDLARIEDGDDLVLEANSLQFQYILSKCLGQIYKTRDQLPPEFSAIFQHVYTCLEVQHEDLEEDVHYWALGGLLFLRFIIPSIYFPDQYGLLDEMPDTQLRRQYVLVSKVIQSIANMATPGNKEQFLVFMSDFISKHHVKVRNYYEAILNSRNNSNTIDSTHVLFVPEEVIIQSRVRIFNTFFHFKEEVFEQLAVRGHIDTLNALEELLQIYPTAISEIEDEKAVMKRKKSTINKKRKKRNRRRRSELFDRNEINRTNVDDDHSTVLDV